MSNKIMKTLTIGGVTYQVQDTRVEDLEARIANVEQNGSGSVVTEEVTIANNAWTALSDASPYNYSTSIALTNSLEAATIIELVNDDPVLFSTYGFAIASASGSNVVVYSIGQPTSDVKLTFKVVN